LHGCGHDDRLAWSNERTNGIRAACIERNGDDDEISIRKLAV
jgi:hypothetical protein